MSLSVYARNVAVVQQYGKLIAVTNWTILAIAEWIIIAFTGDSRSVSARCACQSFAMLLFSLKFTWLFSSNPWQYLGIERLVSFSMLLLKLSFGKSLFSSSMLSNRIALFCNDYLVLAGPEIL